MEHGRSGHPPGGGRVHVLINPPEMRSNSVWLISRAPRRLRTRLSLLFSGMRCSFSDIKNK